MPELPEVETVKNTLKPRLVGKKITDIKIYHENISRKSQVCFTFISYKKMLRTQHLIFYLFNFI